MLSLNDLLLFIPLAAITYVISALLVPKVIQLVHKYDLMDKPNQRKLHVIPTPSMGGLAVCSSIVLVVLISSFFIKWHDGVFIMISLLGFCLLGFLDDWKDLNAKLKLVLQLLFSTVAFLLGFKIDYCFGFLGIYELPIIASYIITMGMYVLLINAYNLIDGIDGLAGGLVTINLAFFTLIFLCLNQYDYALLSIIAIGAMLGFLKYNFHPAKIFLGDSGSLPMGMLMSVFTFKAINSIDHYELPIEFLTWLIPTLIGINAIPLFDTLRVFVLRIARGKSPFSADKTHLHHMFLKNNFGHTCSSAFIHISHIAIVLVGVLFTKMLPVMLGVTIVVIISVLAFELNTIFRLKNKTKEKKHLKKKVDELVKGNRFLVSLKNE